MFGSRLVAILSPLDSMQISSGRNISNCIVFLQDFETLCTIFIAFTKKRTLIKLEKLCKEKYDHAVYLD